MKRTATGLALFAGQAHGALEVAVAAFREMAEAIVARDLPRAQAAAERLHRQAEQAAMHAKVVERLAMEMRTETRRVA